MKQQLEEAGYLVDLRFAGDNEPYMQIKQIESMIIGNCDLLIVTAVEGKPQEHALKPAKDKGIPAIAYDCLVRV